MPHSLAEIPQENWAKLCNLYSENREGPSGYGLLQTISKWIEKDPTLDVKIYALNGDWEYDGTFICVLKGFNYPYISFNALSNDLKCLTAALNCLDTELKYWLFSFSGRLFSAVAEHLKYADIVVDQLKLDTSVWYHIEREKAMQFEANAPMDHKLLPLKDLHAEQINSIWPHRSPGSIKYVKLLINLNESVGLFDGAGNLIAWCLRLHTGSLGLVHVVDSHKRKGFGNLVVRYMAKIVASRSEEVTAAALATNTASRAMFEKLGFSVIDDVYWALKPGK